MCPFRPQSFLNRTMISCKSHADSKFSERLSPKIVSLLYMHTRLPWRESRVLKSGIFYLEHQQMHGFIRQRFLMTAYVVLALLMLMRAEILPSCTVYISQVWKYVRTVQGSQKLFTRIKPLKFLNHL